jgi:hypothetical protein
MFNLLLKPIKLLFLIFEKKIERIIQQTSNLEKITNEIKLNQGLILSNQNLLFKKEIIIENIQLSEFKVFSQWGDDGIINFLINYIDISNKQFIEFGVEDYKECNTRLLLNMYNWSGLVIDGSESNIKEIRKSDYYWKFNLKCTCKFVNAENINQIIEENEFSGEIGLLHIDIDGNDYWLWKSINIVNPIIVIIEYNSVFGVNRPITIPYDSEFDRTRAHFSNLYFGSSLLSLCDLAKEKGYSFIGSNSNGNNAYFIRNDKLKKLKKIECFEGYVESKFRESRDLNGTLTFKSGSNRLKEIEGMKVYNTRTKLIEVL